MLCESDWIDENGRKKTELSSDRFMRYEIMDTIMRVDVQKTKEGPMKGDFTITAEMRDEEYESSFGRIPFRFFINENMHVCPSYLLLNNTINVDVCFFGGGLM